MMKQYNKKKKYSKMILDTVYMKNKSINSYRFHKYRKVIGFSI